MREPVPGGKALRQSLWAFAGTAEGWIQRRTERGKFGRMKPEVAARKGPGCFERGNSEAGIPVPLNRRDSTARFGGR